MNQTFSLSRFGRLLRTYFVENRNILLASVAVLFVVLAAFLVVVYRQYPISAEMSRYNILFIVGGAAWYIFTAQQVTVLNEKERAITYLLRPASLMEKWLQLVVVSGLLYLVVCLSLFTLIDSVGVWFVNHRSWKPEELRSIRINYNNQLTIDSYLTRNQLNEFPRAFWLIAALIHPVSLALALIVRRYTLPLLPVIAFTFVLTLTFLNRQLLQGLFSDQVSVSPEMFGSAFVEKVNTSWRMVRLPQPAGDIIRYGVEVSAVLLLYVTAFFRLKEREV